MAIEILENTLLKLLVRRGTNVDRQQITLESGELGYATDTKRVFVGDGTTTGGVLVGNRYKGTASNLTSLSPVEVGDYAFDSDDNIFYICTSNDGSAAGDWKGVGSYNTGGDNTISIDGTAGVKVGTFSSGGGLSAGNITASALGNSVDLDGSRKIALSSTVNIDTITQRTTTATSFLSLPQKLKISNIDYNFPVGSPGADTFLGSNAAGTLSWGFPGVVSSGVAPTTGAIVPVGTIVPYVSAAANVPHGWLPCDGRSVGTADYPDLSGVIHYAYGGSGTSFKVPNLTNKAVYGSSDPENSTLYHASTAYNAASLSATGMMFIIKAIGGVTSPTLTVTKNLSCTVNGTIEKTGIKFNPLSGDIVIEDTLPGIQTYDTAALGQTFTFPGGVHYVKYYVTGAGATGGNATGGSAATVIGYLSAWPGAVFNVAIGAAANTKNKPGGSSSIKKGGAVIAQSNGGLNNGFRGSGLFTPASIFTLDGYVLTGAAGGVATFKPGEEGAGAASFWGGTGAPGAGGGSEAGLETALKGSATNTIADGIVKFEWS